MSNHKSTLQVAKTIALTLVNRDTDINEFAKVATYLRTHPDGTQFFQLLETMVQEKGSRYLVRTGRTLDYYRDIQDVCQQHLGVYRNANDRQKAQKMAEILGWAVRLMRYYKGAGVPPAERLVSKASGIQPPPAAVSKAAPPQGVRNRKETVPKQVVVPPKRELVERFVNSLQVIFAVAPL